MSSTLPHTRARRSRGAGQLGEQALEDEHLGEGAGGLGHGQDRVVIEQMVAAGERVVDPVAQLVGQGHHVPRPAGVVEEDVGVQVRGDGGAVGAAALAVGQGRVDPAAREEGLGQLDHAAREAGEGAEDQVAGAGEGDGARGAGQGGVAVVVGQVVDAEDPALEAVVAGRGGIAARNDFGHRVDDGAGQLVVEVAARLGLGVTAQAVEDLLLVEEGVVDEGADVGVAAQALGEAGGGAAAQVAVGLVEQGQELALGQLLRPPVALQAEAGAGVDLGGQAGEGAAPHIGGLDQDLLLGLGEVVGRQPALVIEVVVVGRQGRVGGDAVVGRGRDLADLEVEEDEVGAQGAAELARLLQEGAAGRLAGVGGVEEGGEGLGLVLVGEQGLVLVEGGAQVGGGQVGDGDGAAEAGLEGGGAPAGRVHVGGQPRVVGAGVEVGQVPGGQGLSGRGHEVSMDAGAGDGRRAEYRMCPLPGQSVAAKRGYSRA
ncbi:MAG: hypothetical protein ABIL09_06715 [Gemmatimonadota bacterium]